MEIPERGSIQMKNTVNMPQGNTCESCESGDCNKHIGFYFYEDDDDYIAEMRRKARKNDAESFRSEYTFGSSMEQRTCICSHATYSWPDQSSGIMWVGVHGMDSICVVTRTGDLDKTRLRGSLMNFLRYEATLRSFRKSIISEIEDLADPNTSTLHQTYGKRIKKPFGVVSAFPLIPDTNEVHKESVNEPSSDDYFKNIVMFFLDGFVKEASAKAGVYDKKKATSAKHDEKKAIEFLQEKTKSGLAFTVDETIQTAISALQHLFQKKFKAKDIEVSVLDPNYVVYCWEAKYKDILVKELEICEIEEHLAVVNELGSEGSGSGSSGRSAITFESTT